MTFAFRGVARRIAARRRGRSPGARSRLRRGRAQRGARRPGRRRRACSCTSGSGPAELADDPHSSVGGSPRSAHSIITEGVNHRPGRVGRPERHSAWCAAANFAGQSAGARCISPRPPPSSPGLWPSIAAARCCPPSCSAACTLRSYLPRSDMPDQARPRAVVECAASVALRIVGGQQVAGADHVDLRSQPAGSPRSPERRAQASRPCCTSSVPSSARTRARSSARVRGHRAARRTAGRLPPDRQFRVPALSPLP